MPDVFGERMQLTFGDFVLDLDQRRLFAAGNREVHLQPKGFELLRALLEHRPKALSKDAILSRVWPETFVSENTLAAVVRDLRAALGDDAQEPRFIRTVFGFGYAFAGPALADADATIAQESLWCLRYDHHEITLTEGANILGRSGHGVIVFDSPTVSRHHALVRVTGPAATIEDLGSKNGTWLGETRVTAPAPLADGAVLRIGTIVLTARVRHPAPTTQTFPLG